MPAKGNIARSCLLALHAAMVYLVCAIAFPLSLSHASLSLKVGAHLPAKWNHQCPSFGHWTPSEIFSAWDTPLHMNPRHSSGDVTNEQRDKKL